MFIFNLDMEFLKEINVDLILSICAIILSIVSIIIGVRYNRKTFNYTKEQNKLTLEPYLSVELDSFTDNRYIIKLVNNGNGLARLISIYYFLNSRKHQDLIVLLDNSIEKIKSELLMKESNAFFIDGLGHIGSSKEIILFNLKYKENFDIRKFDEILMNVKIVIKYENIYGDQKRLERIISDKRTYKDV